MQKLGVYQDILNEATFVAGLRHSMDTGVVPKPPAPQPPAPTADEIATQQEQARLAAKAKRAEEDERRFAAQNYRSGKLNHADTQPAPESDPLKGLKDQAKAKNESRAKSEAEGMTIYNNRGIDHRATDDLRKIFAYNKQGEVAWQETWALRRIAQSNYAKQKQNVKHT